MKTNLVFPRALVMVYGLVIVLVFSGCNSIIAKPGLEISVPSNLETISTGNVTISVDVSHFKLVDKTGQDNIEGEGHILYFLDVEPPTLQEKTSYPPQDSIWASSMDTSYTFQSVLPGTHTAYAELVNNDDTPLNPPVVAKVTFLTQAGAPQVQEKTLYP